MITPQASHEKVMNKSFTGHEQVMNNAKISDVQVKTTIPGGWVGVGSRV